MKTLALILVFFGGAELLQGQDTIKLKAIENNIREVLASGGSDMLKFATSYDSVAALGSNYLYKGKGQNFLGMSYHLAGNYEQAMTYYFKARDLFSKAKDNFYMALSLNNIGACMEYKRKPDLSIEYYKKALELFEKEKNTTWIANVNNNIGIQFMEAGKLDSASIYHYKAYEQHRMNGDSLSTSTLVGNLAELENNAGNINKAMEFANLYLNNYKAFHQSDVLSNVYNVIAVVNQKKGQFEKANEYNEKSLKIRSEEGVSLHHIANNYLIRSEIQQALGNHKAALDALNIYRTMQDSVFRADRDERITRLSSEFEAKYKNLELTHEKTRTEALLYEANVRKRWYLAVAITIGLLSLLLWYFYRKRTEYKARILQADSEIQKQQITELEQKNQLLSLSAVIEGQESERMRIARDLHDGLGGLLTSVKAHFGSISHEINQLIELDVYKKTNELIDEACSEVRRIAHNMIPHSLQMHGLEGALTDFESFISKNGITPHIEVFQVDLKNISENNAALIYRILQEVIQNIIKHAKATEINIQFLGHEQGLNIQVDDNGKGFDINEVIHAKGMGLKSIESRVKYLNGAIHFDSRIGHGTQVNIELPPSIFTNKI
ncbi:MAG TPA: sensor histidine kinase [Saprospiraceae bacterium]|nr:sensor histidine kinase [Saprospiraceae bacterium]